MGASKETWEDLGNLHSALEAVGLWAHCVTDVEFVKSDHVSPDRESGVLMMTPGVVKGLIDVLRIAEVAVPGLKGHITNTYDISGMRAILAERNADE